MNYAIDQMMRAAEDSESTIDALREELATMERRIAQLRTERDAFLMRERIAVATALDVPYATELGEAVAARLARLTADLAASREALSTLAAAVATVRDARAVVAATSAQYSAAWDASTSPPTASQSEGIAVALRASYEAGDALGAALDALLAAAPPRTTVDARVVREYLAAEADAGCVVCEAIRCAGAADLDAECGRASAAIDRRDTARAALGAALAGCV